MINSEFPMKSIRLNNGVEMPQVGLGTYLIPKDKLTRTIGKAYELGYRQFDTAWKYNNEKEIAYALNDLCIKRQDVFITTKINVDALYFNSFKYGKRSVFNIRNFKSIRKVILESFDNLHTDYVDLFLVHFPWPMYREMYKELEQLYKEGRIRAIGVSSFTIGHLESLKEISDIVPTVNQIELSPLNCQKELLNYCQKNNIAVEAMSTFSHFRSNVPRYELIENDMIQPIADKYNKTVVQIILRWMVQQNIIVIPKTWCIKYLKDNISIFDFELTEEEMNIIDSLDTGHCLNYNPYVEHVVQGIPSKYRHLTPIK